MSAKREDYDREHQRTMELINGGSDLIENFPLNPVEMAREALKNDIERKANKDAYDGRYDPPTKEKEDAARLEAEEFERQQKRRPPSRSEPFSNNEAARSGGEWDWVIKLGFWLAAIVFVIWLVGMALAVTVVLAPIWLGAVTVGVITGFILAQNAASQISDEALSRVPVVEEQKRKTPRIRIAEEFIKGSVKFSPHLLCLIVATAAYGLTLAAWPFFMTTDIFTRILLGVGVVAGTIVGTLAGRRILCWQIENSIFARAEAENTIPLLAPKLALGFSIPGLVALAGLWIIVLFQSPTNLDLAKAFGFKDSPQAIQQPTQGQTLSQASVSNTRAGRSGTSTSASTQRRDAEPQKKSSKIQAVPSQADFTGQLTSLARGEVVGNGSSQAAAPKWSGQSAKHGERFPQTRTRLLSTGDVSGFSKDDLRYAINEMFARYGADFPKAEVKRQFAGFEWYKPRPGIDFDQIEAEFSDLECANLKLLGAVRDSKSVVNSAQSTPNSIASTATKESKSNSNNLSRWSNGSYVQHHQKDTGKELADMENILIINGESVTYQMKYQSRLKPGSAQWSLPALRSVRICQKITEYRGRVKRISENEIIVKMTSKQVVHSNPSGWHKLGPVWLDRSGNWTFIRTSDGVCDGHNPQARFVRKN